MGTVWALASIPLTIRFGPIGLLAASPLTIQAGLWIADRVRRRSDPVSYEIARLNDRMWELEAASRDPLLSVVNKGLDRRGQQSAHRPLRLRSR